MPRLPTYTAEVSQYGVPSGRRASSADFFDTSVQRAAGKGAAFAASAVNHAASLMSQSPVGEGLQRLGGAVRDAAEDYMQLKEKRDVADQQIKAAQARARAYQKMDELRAEGELGIPEKMDEFLQEQTEFLRNNASTRAGMEAAERSIAALSIDVGHSARTTEAKILGQKAQEDATQMLAAHGEVLETDPEMLPRLIDEYTVWARNIGLPEQAERALIREGHARLAITAANQWTQFDPEIGKKMVESGKFDPWIDTETKTQLIKGADAAIEREERKRRIDRAEARQISQIEREALYTDYAIELRSGERSATAIIEEMENVARQRNALGEPKLFGTHVDKLYSIAEKEASGESVETPRWLLQQAAVEEMRTGAPAMSTIVDNIDLWSNSDLKYYPSRATEAKTEVRNYRKNHMNEALGGAGIKEEHMWLYPGVSTVFAELSQTAIKREEQYRAAGEDPALYYTGGAKGLPSAEDDRQAFGPAFTQAMTRGEQAYEDIQNTSVGQVFQDPEDPTQFFLRTAPGPISSDTVMRVEADSLEEAQARADAVMETPETETDPASPAVADPAAQPDDPSGARSLNALREIEAEIEASRETGAVIPPWLGEQIRKLNEKLGERRSERLESLRERPGAKTTAE